MVTVRPPSNKCSAQSQISPAMTELRSVLSTCLPHAGFSWGRKMQTVVLIVIGWFVISLMLGPVLTWMFFYPARRADAASDHATDGIEPTSFRDRTILGQLLLQK